MATTRIWKERIRKKKATLICASILTIYLLCLQVYPGQFHHLEVTELSCMLSLVQSRSARQQRSTCDRDSARCIGPVRLYHNPRLGTHAMQLEAGNCASWGSAEGRELFTMAKVARRPCSRSNAIRPRPRLRRLSRLAVRQV